MFNFNNKYSIVCNSCGTACSYIILIDLSNGNKNSFIFSDYSLSEAGSIIINNAKYIFIPVTKENSNGIIMKYNPLFKSNKICYEQKMKKWQFKNIINKVKVKYTKF